MLLLVSQAWKRDMIDGMRHALQVFLNVFDKRGFSQYFGSVSHGTRGAYLFERDDSLRTARQRKGLKNWTKSQWVNERQISWPSYAIGQRVDACPPGPEGLRPGAGPNAEVLVSPNAAASCPALLVLSQRHLSRSWQYLQWLVLLADEWRKRDRGKQNYQ
jgi:hypothetical protein